MDTTISRTIEEIPREDWEAIFPDKLRNHHFFKSIDTDGFKGLRHYYIMVYHGGRPVGAAPCFLFNYPVETTLGGFLKALLSVMRRLFPATFNLKTLACGLPGSEGRIGIAPEYSEQVLRAVLAAMEKIARKERAAILAFKDFSSEYTNVLDGLLRHNFHKVESYPSVELDICFKSFDEYMQALSHSTRKDLKRKIRKTEGFAKIDLEVSNNADHLLDDIYSLYQQTFFRSSTRFEEVTKNFFKKISMHMPNHSKYFLWRVNNRLVAFNLCLTSEDILTDEYLGLDYAVAHDYHLYFLTFRDVINWCIANGIKKYRSGALTYEPKKRLKCSFVPCYAYVRHMSRVMNPLFGLVCAALRPENYDPILREVKNRRIKSTSA